MATLGILFVLAAVLSWTVGDYCIEQSTRKVGDIETLFFIGLGGFLGLLPFVSKDLAYILSGTELKILLLLAVVSFFSAVFLFEALKRGKLSIIEPVFGIELPVVIILSIIFGHEHLDWIFYSLSAVVFGGLILTVTRWEHLRFTRGFLEKGVLLAIVGSVGMGVTDFLTGYSSRLSSPILTIWFLHSSIGLFALIILLFRRRVRNLFKDFKANFKPVLGVAIFDNAAWVCYAFAMVYLPISIATTISESYIALVVLLGVVLNKERIQRHQVVGIIVVILAVMTLSYLVEY